MLPYYSPFPVRTVETLKSVLRGYLVSPNAYTRGPSRVAFGPMLVTPQATTLVTIRISEREPRQELIVNTRNGKTFQVWRDVYKVAYVTFVVIELDGRTGIITELASRPTKKEADAVLRAIHAER